MPAGRDLLQAGAGASATGADRYSTLSPRSSPFSAAATPGNPRQPRLLLPQARGAPRVQTVSDELAPTAPRGETLHGEARRNHTCLTDRPTKRSSISGLATSWLL